MTWEIREPAEHQLNRVRKFCETNILGADAKEAMHVETVIRSRASRFLPMDSSGAAYPTFWRAAWLPDGSLVGAVCAHPPYSMVIQIATQPGGQEYARGLARARRVLGSIAVREDMRGQGVGRALLAAVEANARIEGVSHITGFMDERNGEPSFYERNGYRIMPLQEPVPRLEPYPVTESHPEPTLFGHWFYKQL